MSCKLKIIILALFSFFGSFQLLGQNKDVISINTISTGRSIEKSVVYTMDENYDLEEIIHLPDTAFKAYRYEDLPEGTSYFWIKVEFENLEDDLAPMILGTSKFDSITAYYKNELGFWEKQYAGRELLNSNRKHTFDANNYIYFEINGHSRAWVYLKIKNSFKITYQYSPLPITVFHFDYFQEYENAQKAFTYFFLGAILLMTLYNLILFLQLRTRIYLYYVLNNLGIFLFVLSQRGGLTRAFFDNMQNHEYILLVLGNLAFVFYVLFCKEILQFSKLRPKWNRVLNIILISYPFLLVFVWVDPMIAASIGGVIAISVYTWILVATFQAASRGQTEAKFFLFGNLFYYFGIIISILQSSNIFPTEILGLSAINYVEIGTIIQLTLFSLTLGYRINIMQEEIAKKELEQKNMLEKEEHKRIKLIEEKNIELEKKVLERTMDIASKNKQLRSAIQEKEILLKEIHHRVKNNLQLTSSLLNLQSKQVKDENTKMALKEGQARIKSMSLVHQKLYQSESLSEIPFEEYLEQLTANIKHSSNFDGKEIEIKIHADKTLAIDQAIPLGIICNELITNSFKYAFEGKENGLIEINFVTDDENAEFTYKDNGVGLKDKDPERTNSLGLNLVQMLSRQLHGELQIESNGGLSFQIKFPLQTNNN